MNKFKRIFYPFYIFFTLGFLYLSIDSLLNMESQLVWFNEKIHSGIPTLLGYDLFPDFSIAHGHGNYC